MLHVWLSRRDISLSELYKVSWGNVTSVLTILKGRALVNVAFGEPHLLAPVKSCPRGVNPPSFLPELGRPRIKAATEPMCQTHWIINICVLFCFCCDSAFELQHTSTRVGTLAVNNFCCLFWWEPTEVSIMISYWALLQWKVGVLHILNPSSHPCPNFQNLELPKYYE